MQSVKICALVAVSFAFLLYLYLIPNHQTWQISPSDSHEQNPSAPGKDPTTLGELGVYLGLISPTGKTVGPWGPSLCVTMSAWMRRNAVKFHFDFTALLTLLMWSFSFSVVQRDASASSPYSGIFLKYIING